MAEAARRAEADAGGGLLRRVELVASVMSISLRHPDPGRLVADRLGLSDVRTLQTRIGGNLPQYLLNDLGPRSPPGGSTSPSSSVDASTAAAARGPGCPRKDSRREGDGRPCPHRARRGSRPAGGRRPAGLDLGRDGPPGRAPDAGVPVVRERLRAAAGRSLEEHQRVVSELWSGFAAVAAGRPSAWSRRRGPPRRSGPPGPATGW